MFDLGLTALGLVLFALPMLGIGLAVWAHSGHPVFFHQARIGREGKPFVLWKFRTLTEDGRVTKIGQLLRGTAMDELPQLFQILKGEMSFVGPRPLIPEDLKELALIPDGNLRLSVRPGLTGMAQLFCSKTPTLSERLSWDLAYTRRCSLKMDAWLLARSVPVTLRAAWEKAGAKGSPPERLVA